MLHRTITLGLAVAIVTLAGCDGPSPSTPVDDAVTHMDVRAPRITDADLVTRTFTRSGPESPDPLPTGSRRSSEERPAGIQQDWSDPLPFPQIFDARTEVGFLDGLAYAQGIHEYNSNVAAVSVTANVDFQGQHLASKSGHTQNFTPFLLNIVEIVKSIGASALVYSDKECGLSIQADSRHEAWWQFFLGGPVATWGKAIATSQASPVSQDRCSATGTRIGGGAAGPGGLVCYYFITYELATGKIVSADLLFCSREGGELA